MTPLELALELRVSDVVVRRILRAEYGPLPRGEKRWSLTKEQADYVRREVARRRGQVR